MDSILGYFAPRTGTSGKVHLVLMTVHGQCRITYEHTLTHATQVLRFDASTKTKLNFEQDEPSPDTRLVIGVRMGELSEDEQKTFEDKWAHVFKVHICFSYVIILLPPSPSLTTLLSLFSRIGWTTTVTTRRRFNRSLKRKPGCQAETPNYLFYRLIIYFTD